MSKVAISKGALFGMLDIIGQYKHKLDLSDGKHEVATRMATEIMDGLGIGTKMKDVMSGADNILPEMK